MWLVYGIISGSIAVISIVVLGYRMEYYGLHDSKIGDEIGGLLFCIVAWPLLAPVAILWGIGHLVARRRKQIAVSVADPNKYRSQ